MTGHLVCEFENIGLVKEMDFVSYKALTRFSLKIGCDGRVNGEKKVVRVGWLRKTEGLDEEEEEKCAMRLLDP